eukprot:SM000201S05929  [mRNA]  locus=s201:126885:130185:+ [translate_table: standard]
MSAIQDRLSGLVGRSSGYLESLPAKVHKRVAALQDLQHKHDELEEQFLEERRKLEAKYLTLYEPLYQKRGEIVTGAVEPEEKPDAGPEAAQGAPERAEAGDESDAEVSKGIPEFWLTALKNNEVTSEQITEKDEEALKHLINIKWRPLEEGKGFTLDLEFEPNPFFKNTTVSFKCMGLIAGYSAAPLHCANSHYIYQALVTRQQSHRAPASACHWQLSKTYHMIDEDEPILEKAEATTIEWLPGKNLTQKVLKKKPKKGAKNTKPITKIEQCESFFNFFSPPQVPGDDEQISADEAEQLQEEMENDYEVGSMLKEKIIPHAVKWFTGVLEDCT